MSYEYIKDTHIDEIRDQDGEILQEGTPVTERILNKYEDAFEYLFEEVMAPQGALTVSLITESPVASTSTEVENGQGVDVTGQGSFVINHCNVQAVTLNDAVYNTDTLGESTLEANTDYCLSAVFSNGSARLNIALKATPTTALHSIGELTPEKTFNTGSETEFVFFATNDVAGDTPTISEIMLNAGTYKLPYIEGIQPLRNVAVKCVGENLCPPIASWSNYNSTLAKERMTKVGKNGLVVDNVIGALDVFLYSPYIVVDTSSVVYVKSDILSGTGQVALQLYNSKKQLITESDVTSGGAVTMTDETKYITARLGITATQGMVSVEFENPSIILGTTAPTEYKPYVESESVIDGWWGDNDTLHIEADGRVWEERNWIREKLSDLYSKSQVASNSFTRLTNTLRVHIVTDRIYTNHPNTDAFVVSKFGNYPYLGDFNNDSTHQYTNVEDSTFSNQLALFIPLSEIDAYAGSDQEKFEAWLVDNDNWWYMKHLNFVTIDLTTEKGINTHSGEKCTFSVTSGIVEREKANPVLDSGLYQLNKTDVDGTRLDFNTNNIKRILKERLIGDTIVSMDDTENWTIVKDNTTYGHGGCFAYATEAIFDTQANYYIDYEILHSEHDNQQVNASISYKQNVHDTIDNLNQRANRAETLVAENVKQLRYMNSPIEEFDIDLLNGVTATSAVVKLRRLQENLYIVKAELLELAGTSNGVVIGKVPIGYEPSGNRYESLAVNPVAVNAFFGVTTDRDIIVYQSATATTVSGSLEYEVVI